MISQMAFDALLPSSAASTVAQNGSDANTVTQTPPPTTTSTVDGGEDGRKRKRSRVENGEEKDDDENNNSNEGKCTALKIGGVEQQLAASSPGMLFQHALLNNASGASDGEQSGNQEAPPAPMDFFEAQKIFQKLGHQLATGFGDVRPPSATVPTNPFVQQLASLSPFLLALQHQSQQFQAHQQHFDPASLLAIPPIQQHSNNDGFDPLGMGIDTSPYEDGDEEGPDEGQQTEPGGGSENPEDLSLKNGSAPTNGSTPNCWSYGEQFKQLYELSDDPLRREMLDDWLQYMGKIGKPVSRIPIMAKSVLDLYELYRLVVHHGGLVEVINKKLWREITKGLNLPSSITSAAFTLRTQYEKFLFDYECHQHNFATLGDLRTAIEANKREGRRNGPPGAPGNGPGSNSSARTTPSRGHGHGHQHHSSSGSGGGRHSASEQRQQQQQAVAATHWMQHMAAAFSAATGASTPPSTNVLPPPPFFGTKSGTFFGGGRDENGADLNLPCMPPFALVNGHNNNNDTSNNVLRPFGNIFPKVELITAPTSSSPSASVEQQKATTSATTDQNVPSSALTDAPLANSSNNKQHRLLHHPPSSSGSTSTAPKRRRTSPAAGNNNGVEEIPSTVSPDSVAGAAMAMGHFGAMLRGAGRCSVKMVDTPNNNNDRTNNAFSPPVTSSSMVVSMELNGQLYQGVLFAMDQQQQQQETDQNDANGLENGQI